MIVMRKEIDIDTTYICLPGDHSPLPCNPLIQFQHPQAVLFIYDIDYQGSRNKLAHLGKCRNPIQVFKTLLY